jgi:broad specificity phosphatase PhoE
VRQRISASTGFLLRALGKTAWRPTPRELIGRALRRRLSSSLLVFVVNKLLLIRHGHTRDNAELGDHVTSLDGTSAISEGKRLSGWNAVPLSMLGASQAINAGHMLSQFAWAKDACWLCSPQLRAMQTLAGVCCGAALNPDDLRVRQITGLMERSAGDLTGLTWAQAAREWPEMLLGKNANVFKDVDSPYPGGESLRMVHARAAAALRRFLASEQELVVVCHELTIKTLLAELLYQQLDARAFQFEVPNASVISLSANAEGVWTRHN